MRIRLSVLLVVTAISTAPSCAAAQRHDQVGIAADTQHVELKILDDFGIPISEKEIRRYQGKGGLRWFMQPFAFGIGAGAVWALVPKGPSKDGCSIYDPCSDREKFFRGSSAMVGGIVGLLLANAAGPGMSRAEAVEKVRAERRLMHKGGDQR